MKIFNPSHRFEDFEDPYFDDEGNDPDANDGNCEECGCYHGHHPWCSEYDPSYTGDDNDW